MIKGEGLEISSRRHRDGAGLYINGHHVPNIDLGTTPSQKKSYEERSPTPSERDRERALEQARPPDRRAARAHLQLPKALYRRRKCAHVDASRLPKNVKIVENVAGLLGGIMLWRDA